MESAAVFNERLLECLRPNFFELVANEAMQEALRPAFQYLCKVLAQNRPDLFDRLWQFSDELYSLLECALQTYFLVKYSGSFSERFYCLKRSAPGHHGNSPLRRKELILSLICLTAVPYLREKMDGLFLKLQEEDDLMPITWRHGDRTKALCKYLYFMLYPYLSALYKGLRFMFRLRYLFSQTNYYSPLLWLAGVTLQRDLEPPSTKEASQGWLTSVTGAMVPLTVFGLKLLEWWYSAERSTAVRLMTSLPVPPPPKPMQPSANGVRVPTNPLLCPLCLGRRVEPTTIATSGYVFCYACILNYLRENHKCPVTCLPCTEKQIIKLYTRPVDR